MKSSYRLIVKECMDLGPKQAWSFLSKSKLHERNKVFFLKITFIVLKVKHNLQNFDFNINVLFPLCLEETEIIEHLFIKWKFVREL